MFRSIPLLALLALTSVTATARAEEAAGVEDGAYRVALSGMQLEAGSGMLFSRKNEVGITRYNMYFMPRMSFYDRVSFAPRLNLTTIDLDLRQPEDLPIDASLSLPWQLSVGVDLQYRQPVLKWLDVIAFYRFEFPASENVAEIESFQLHRIEGAPEINVTADEVRDHIRVTHTWRSFSLGATVMAHSGWFHPYIDIGYISMVGRLTIALDSDANRLLSEAKVNPDRFYETNLSSIYYAAGSEFDLGDRFRFRLGATAIAQSDGDWILNVETGVRIPFSLDPK